ncbi:hypothetical protein BD310DRAFT_824367 [Dichomitus squalens]|uniref:DUF6533 domain-containing protein n=1 Tax=Dichomitus squalens TaxID=114155 RepID=A0A4Q9PPP3_9APHY|nr:hypothetical protein BD310DRAFT_824367 [Dichomitus squalens]
MSQVNPSSPAMAQLTSYQHLFPTIALTVLYYDFAQTIHLEVERYWFRTLSWASVLFFLNRYNVLLAHTLVVYELVAEIPDSVTQCRCRQLQTFRQILIGLSQGIVALCLLLRTHALYRRNRRVLYLLVGMLTLGAAVVVWSIFSLHSLQEHSPPDTTVSSRCSFPISMHQATFLAIAWGVMLVFDGTIFVLTLLQGIRSDRLWSHGLLDCMLKDGAVYFGVLAICYLFTIITYLDAPTAYRGIFTTLTNVLSNVLVSRMMLNIRDPGLLEFRIMRSRAAGTAASSTQEDA